MINKDGTCIRKKCKWFCKKQSISYRISIKNPAVWQEKEIFLHQEALFIKKRKTEV